MGSEVNILKKDADVRVALCFPDTYEIGMSHLGFKILYGIINNIPNASAERVYAPWVDYEALLRENGLPLTSLEQKRPLKDFDIIGFTLQYELSYTNVLNMLDMSGIPVRAVDRGENFPLVIAGGPCTVNPVPMAPFIDAFVIGDGEDVIVEILAVVCKFKKNPPSPPFAKEGNKLSPTLGKGDTGGFSDNNSISKYYLLNTLSQIEGIYVPVIHDANKQRVKRRFIEDLDKAPYPDNPVVPYMAVVHDRAAIEVARGCTRGCRFCQAGMIYRPMRERSLENVLSLAQRSLLNTGFEEVSFTSLSAGDYSSLLPLLKSFNRVCALSSTSVSLPSLRVGSINSEVLKEIKSVRKTGFTIAPEAGTKRLRDVINKDFTDEEYQETLKKLFSEGWQNIKLYFMIGLPSETTDDINGLIDMAVLASKKGKEITRRRINVNVGISAFVPKPHTPFQWTAQEPLGELRKKQDHLRNVFKKRGIQFKGQHVENSLLEAVFARGDEKAALLLEEAWKQGCRFDGWAEHFNFEKWLHASEAVGIDLYSYATRTYSLEENLPWDFIDIGVTKDYLKSEYTNAFQETITADCRNGCTGCGLACEVSGQKSVVSSQGSGVSRQDLSSYKISVPTRIRVRFSKTGEMRYLSHSEIMTAMFRALRRAAIPIAYSTGFHPHPKLSFGPALSVGIEGLNEYFDIELTALIDAPVLLQKLNGTLPDGLRVQDAVLIPTNMSSLTGVITRYAYEVALPPEKTGLITSFMEKPSCPVSREKGPVDIRPAVESAEVRGDTLHLMLVDTADVKVRLSEILQEMLQISYEEFQTLLIKRSRLYGYNKGVWTEPM